MGTHIGTIPNIILCMRRVYYLFIVKARLISTKSVFESTKMVFGSGFQSLEYILVSPQAIFSRETIRTLYQ